jgi:hypothetical protein
VAIVVFGLGQLVIPPLAEHIARDRLARYGRVLSVKISAFPAIKLLFGDADSATVRMSSYTAAQNQVGVNLSQASGVSQLVGTIAEVSSGLVNVEDVSFSKHGNLLLGSGEITEANLRAAVPLLQSVTPIASSGSGVTLQGTTDNLPIVGSVSADANLAASGGKVVLSGTGLIGGFLHITVWSDPRLYVQSISGEPTRTGLKLSVRGRVR